jgi:hypothetical protein
VSAPFTFATEAPIVLRLDQRFFEALERHRDLSGDEPVLHAARALVGYGAFFEAALGPNVDLFPFYRRLLDVDGEAVEKADKSFREADLTHVVEELYGAAKEVLGPPPGPAPEVVFLIGEPRGTNARTYGFDVATGRPRVMLNVAAHRDLDALRVSIAHELVHTFQRGEDSSLGSAAKREGVAVFVSGELTGTQSEAALLMWPAEKLAAAEAHQDAILTAFRSARSAPRDRAGDWLTLGHPLATVPGAPDRSAYYLGFLAAKAWRTAHPRAPLADLFDLSMEDFFAVLD